MLPKQFNIDGEIITDTVYNKLYLALWSECNKSDINLLCKHIYKLNSRLKLNVKNRMLKFEVGIYS